MSANKKFTGIASDLYKEQTKIIQSQRNQIKELQEQNTHLTQRMEYLEEINTEYKELKSAFWSNPNVTWAQVQRVILTRQNALV